MPFNPDTDKIAITLQHFTLLKHADPLLQRYNEPYILGVAVDASGRADPGIDYSFMPFPKVARGGSVTMLGDGHLIYGPRNPGEFVAISVLIMENDRELQELGAAVEQVLQSKATDLGIKTLLAANPGYASVLAALKELTQLVAGFLKQDGDDELFRTEGTFLKGHPVPYHINRAYDVGNDFVNLRLKVIPLKTHNQEGPRPRTLAL